jgi:hypothetical protein
MVHGIKHYALFTSHAPWVQLVVLGGSLQADKRFHVCRRGGGTGGNHAGQADARGEGKGPRQGFIKITEGYGGRGEGLIMLEKAVEEGEVAESHSEMFGR